MTKGPIRFGVVTRRLLSVAATVLVTSACAADSSSDERGAQTTISGPSTSDAVTVQDRFDDPCEAVEEALRLLASASAQDNSAGAALASDIWDVDLDVPAGEGSDWHVRLRSECALEVLEMLDAACLPVNGQPNRSRHC